MAAVTSGEHPFLVKYGGKSPYEYGTGSSYVKPGENVRTQITLLERLGGNVKIRPSSRIEFERQNRSEEFSEEPSEESS